VFQQNVNGIKTSSAPFVTADGWVWFRGTDDKLWRMKTDGSLQSNPGGNKTLNTPFVTADGWVWFQGPNNALCRMKTDGSEFSAPGSHTTLNTPFVTADGWVWFRATNNALCCMKTDGSEFSAPGNAKTSGTPLVTADGWVWFRGLQERYPDDAPVDPFHYRLYRMKRDGTQLSMPGDNDGPSPSSPFVTADGWVWFQGAGDKLFRMKPDGSQQTQVDGNRTASSPAVGPMTVAQGVVGEWVWFRGIGEGALWRDFVPASALGPPETVEPAYYVVTVAYAPPGAKGGGTGSLVQYDSSSSTGTTTSTSKSFKAGTEVGASIGKDFIDASISASWSETETSSLSISKGQAYTIKMSGPGADGINHDYDLFLLLLNPVVTAQQYPQNFVLWSMGTKGPAEIHEVYAGELKKTWPMADGTKAALDKRGLTDADYAQILSTNPFAKGSGTIDPDRFIPINVSFPYRPPPPGGGSTTQTLTLSNEQTQTSTHEATAEYSASMKVQFVPKVFYAKSTLTWTNKSSSGKSATSKQSASATVGGPAAGFNGPDIVQIYWDTVYSSFMFAFNTKAASYTGELRAESGQPVAYEPVTLTVGGHQFSTFTDGLGEYRFHDTPDGQGTIAVRGHQMPVEVGGSEKLVTHLPRRQ
jgi:hypothetical protein